MIKKLVVLGSINVDHILTLADFPSPGETKMGIDYQPAFGGKGANQAVAAARAGITTQFIAAVGEDSAGQTVITALNNDHINTDNIEIIPRVNTGLAMIFINQQGENEIGIYGGANNALTPEVVTLHQSIITESNMLLVQLEIPTETIELAIQWAKEATIPVILNPAPAKPLSQKLLSRIDIIVPNQTETELLTGVKIRDNKQDPRKAAAILHKKGIPTVIITLGENGVFVSEDHHSYSVAAHKVKVIDTLGAGDTFCGALAAALLEGKSLEEAVKFSNQAAAITVSRKGAIPAIPYKQEILNFSRELAKI